MTILQNTAEKLLNHLQDSIKGYEKCSQETESINFISKFKQLQNSRERMLEELKALTLPVDNKEVSGSTAGLLHRYFLDIKTMLTQDKIDSLIKEINRGEQVLIKAYEDAITGNDITPANKIILQQQLQQIKAELSNLNFAA